MKNILLYSTLTIALVGCGGGSGGGSGTYEGPMSPQTKYTMYAGDRVEKASSSAIVQITHVDGQNQSTIELVEGNATIIRQP
ncbi:MAG: hypothetical protein FAF03_06450 [Epsilonproteobacteria bacterium]|nr:hypothetical protein [Campylobacterota bacterium]